MLLCQSSWTCSTCWPQGSCLQRSRRIFVYLPRNKPKYHNSISLDFTLDNPTDSYLGDGPDFWISSLEAMPDIAYPAFKFSIG